MNAEIFYLEHQRGSLPRLKGLLRQHVYPALSIIEHRIEWANERDASRAGWRYVKLLQASIPPEKGIELNIHELGIFGYRFYIEVYYAFRYLAGKTFQTDRLSEFFPAVAMQDRMVLIPAGIGKKLEYGDQILSPFNPIDMGGVLEVDFAEAEALKDAMARVGQILRSDFLKELRAYASYQDIREMSMPKVAGDLGVDAGFIGHALETEAAALDFYEQLTCEFDQSRVSPARWTRVHLRIRNDSAIDLDDLAISIRGPAGVQPSRVAATVPAHSAAELPIAIKPEDKGDFPLEISFALPEDRLFANWLPVHHIWLESE